MEDLRSAGGSGSCSPQNSWEWGREQKTRETGGRPLPARSGRSREEGTWGEARWGEAPWGEATRMESRDWRVHSPREDMGGLSNSL